MRLISLRQAELAASAVAGVPGALVPSQVGLHALLTGPVKCNPDRQLLGSAVPPGTTLGPSPVRTRFLTPALLPTPGDGWSEIASGLLTLNSSTVTP